MTPTKTETPSSTVASSYGFDEEDFTDEEHRLLEEGEMKSRKDALLYEAEFDDGRAMADGYKKIETLKARNIDLDDLGLSITSDEDDEDAIVNLDDEDKVEKILVEYCDNEDEIRYLSAAIASIRSDILRRASVAQKEVSAQTQMGFRGTPTISYDSRNEATPVIGAPKWSTFPPYSISSGGKRHPVPNYQHKVPKLVNTEPTRFAD